jgi:protein-S-isoprenylcysteine O-methyltransferase Ste14
MEEEKTSGHNHKLSPDEFKKLRNTVILRFIMAIVFLGVIFFIPAGTIFYWEAWVYCAMLLIPMLFFLIYLLNKSPETLMRRMKTTEKEKRQKLLIGLTWLVFLLAFVIPGLDFRFGWSRVPIWLVVVSALIILGGYLIFMLVVRENEYAARTVVVEKDQQVISTGPYSLVRHPLYTGVLLIFIFSPLALGSFWALIAFIPLPVLVILRIFNEEKVLSLQLPGYKEYMQKVKYRLIPYIW